jgi:hypothetical protein
MNDGVEQQIKELLLSGPGKKVTFVPFPEDFPNKGKFISWDKAWKRVGYQDEAPHPGAQPIRSPEDASPVECFMGGYLREVD